MSTRRRHNIQAADGIIAATVVGASKIMIVIVTNRLKVGVAEGDIASLAEGLAISDALAVVVEDRGEVAQVGLVGDGVGVGASLVGGREEVAAEFYAQLVLRGVPVRCVLILQGERWRGGHDILEVITAVKNLVAKGNEVAIGALDVDALEARTIPKALVTDAGNTGGQGNLGEGIAMVESIGADGGDARADGGGGQLLTANEGVLADGGDAVANGDAGEVVAPGSVGVPDAGVVVAVVVHRPAAADGQHGVIAAAVFGEAPCGVGAAPAADGAVGHIKACERSTTGECDRVRRTRRSIGAAHHVAAVLEHHAGNGDGAWSGKGERRAGVECGMHAVAYIEHVLVRPDGHASELMAFVFFPIDLTLQG